MMVKLSLKMAFVAVWTIIVLVGSIKAQPIISEYVEGSGFNKCIEVYNPGPATLNLGAFGYRAYHNGATAPTYEFTLPAVSLTSGQVYVICHPNATASCAEGAQLTDSRLLFNGDDAIALYDTASGTNVDIFGSIGEDPGSRWTGVCGHFTKDRTLRRKGGVGAGVTGASTGFPSLCTEWDEFSNNDCSGLGSPSQEILLPSCNPIISQYVEGTGNCKFVEIYNPCCDAIDLSNYEVSIYFNSCSTIYDISLGGLLPGNALASGGVVVLYNPLETCTDFSVSGSYPSNFFPDNRVAFNGNDAVVLGYAPLSAAVDILGNICEDSVWTDSTCNVSTQNETLVRNAPVCSGVAVDPVSGFPTLCSEWTALGEDILSDLGLHTSDCLEECASGKQAEPGTFAPGLEVYPNPFHSVTNFRFSSQVSGTVRLEMFSLTGEVVAVLFDQPVDAHETFEVSFDGSQQPAGTYIYRLSTPTGNQFGKVFRAR